MSTINIDMLLSMRHSPLYNYIVPGLHSWLIGNPGPNGTLRLFDCERDQQEAIVPHTHRFNFQCWVMRGKVRNRRWRYNSAGDPYRVSKLLYGDTPGDYQVESQKDIKRFDYADDLYEAGSWYRMEHSEFHSIFFSRNTLVLFFEGPQVADHSFILEPITKTGVIPLMRTEPWMFQKSCPSDPRPEVS